MTSLNSWLRQRSNQVFRSTAGQHKQLKARSRQQLEVECLENRVLLSSVLGIPIDSHGNPVWINPMPAGLNTNPITNPNWASDLAGGLSGRLKTGLNPDINPANLERVFGIASGFVDAGSPGTFVEWRPILAANGGITNLQNNLHGGLDQFDNNLVAISGTAIDPDDSGDDVHVSHPFGSDAEFYVLPDNQQYLSLFAPTNYTSAGGVAFAQNDVPGVQDTSYAQAIQDAQVYVSQNGGKASDVKGVLGVETDQGLLPDFMNPGGYGPQATGDSVAVWGRWIVDAGHPDFHTEIHPPLLVASAHPLPGLGETDSTVVGRPYLVDQLGYQTDDGVQHDGGVFDHIGNEVRKVLGNGNFLGIPSSTTLEAHPNLLPTFAPGDTQIKVMDYVVQASIPSPGPDYRLIANMSFTVRTGITVSVTKLPGQDAVAVHVTMNPTQYQQAPPPANKTTYYDDQLVGGVGEGVLGGLGEILLSPVTNPLFGLAGAINGAQAIARGISTDTYTLSVPNPPLFQIAADSLQGDAHATVDDDQPFPIIGKLQLFWTNEPIIGDEYKALGGNSSFLGLPLDASGHAVQQSDPIIIPSGSVEFANFERGRMFYSLATGTVAIGATGATSDGQGGTILSGTMIIRGSPVDDNVVVKSVAVHDFYTDRETGKQLFDLDDHYIRVDDTFPQFPQFDFTLTFRSVQDDPKFGDPSDTSADAADLFTVIDFASFATASGDQGNDTFTNQTSVPSAVAAGNGADTLVDQTGHGSLSGPASATTWNITAVNAGSYAGAGASGSFTGFENLSGGSAPDTFQFSGQGSVTFINAGSGAGNTLDYSNYPGAVNYALRTRIIPGGPGTGFTLSSFGVTTGVTSSVTNFQTVIGSPFGRNTIAGAQQAVFPVTAATLPLPGTAIDGSRNAHATLVGDKTSNNWTITGQGSGTINGTPFTGFDDFEGGSATDNFLLKGAWQVGGPVKLQIHGNDGDDTLTVDFSNGNPLPPASGLVFDGGGGNNKLLLQGGGPALSVSYTATGPGTGTVSGLFNGSAAIQEVDYSGVQTLVDQLAAQSRSFVDAALAPQQIRLADDDASQGGLSVIDSNGTGAFPQVAFAAPTGQLSIQGGADDTTIKIDKRDRPYSLFVDGGGGVNTLDYSDFPTAVAVNLPAGTATGTSGIKNIQDVTGSQFDDTIVGLPTAMVNGNGGNDTLSGAGVAFFQLNPALPPPKAIDGSGNTRSVVGVLGGLNNSWIVSSLGSGTVDSIPFSGMTDLSGGAGGNAFQFAAGAGVTGMISGGGGTNTLDYSRQSTGVTVNLANGAGTGAGGIRNIQSIVSSRFANQITSGGTTTHTFYLSPNAAAGTVITGNGNDTLVGGDTANTWIIMGNSSGNGVSGTVNGVSFSGISHIIGGKSGQDTLVGPNTASTWNITGPGAGSVGALGFSQIQNLTGGSADDQFVATADGSVSGTIDGGGGNNSLSATEAAGNVTNWVIDGPGSGHVGQRLVFTGMQNLVGQGGVDSFQFSSGGSIAGTVAGGSDVGNILSYANETGSVTVNLQTGAAPQIAGGAPGGFSGITVFQGSTSTANTFVGPNANTAWTVSAANGGSGSAGSFAFSFTGFQNLVGGAGGDVFRFTRTGSLSGSLNGGASRQGNWLDYSGLTTSVTVNLQTGSASSVAGGISNIQNVHGGNAGNTLTGDSHGNILIGGSGSDRITGGTGVSLLIGDLGTDTITGGSGGDILIGDATVFDSMTVANEAALMATLAEWQSADSYTTRFTLINSGTSGGLTGLTGAGFTGGRLAFGITVKDDSATDTVTAAKSTAALDWFFKGTGDVLGNGEVGEVINNNNNTPAAFKDRTVTSEGGLATVSGTITEPDASDSFTLVVNWGDGTPDETYIFPPGSGGQRVSVTHRYLHEGNYTIALSWTDPVGPANQATLPVAIQAVANAPLSGNSVGISVPSGTVASNVVVATFTDMGGAQAGSDYSVLINWGDGSAPTSGIVTGSPAAFAVTGTHTYAAPGRFLAQVTIQDNGGQSITVNSPAVIGSASERLVAQVYLDLLGRFVDAVGLASFTGLLAQGVSAAQVVRLIESSQEYHLAEVQAAYQLLLHRAADPLGLRDDVGLLDSGATIEQVEAIIAGSPEYFSIRGGGTNDGFLTAIYGDLLHRAPGSDGRAAFDQILQTHTTAQAAAIILGSLEYKRDPVESYYEKFLHRAGDANGLATFTALLNSGMRDEEVIANILGSAEYMGNL
jgi:hypothetical protein